MGSARIPTRLFVVKLSHEATESGVLLRPINIRDERDHLSFGSKLDGRHFERCSRRDEVLHLCRE